MMKEYLGDAVYAEYTDRGIELTTEDGIRVTNRIFLEPEVLHALISFAKRAGTESPEP